MKFLSRKDEFSGGRCSGLQVSREELLSGSVSVVEEEHSRFYQHLLSVLIVTG